MRLQIVGGIALLGSGFGCSDTCGSPQQLNGREWDAFVTALEYGPADLGAFPAGSSPANGTHAYIFDWASQSPKGPVTVTIDGQTFDGEGGWNTLECGHFSVTWSGVYEAEDGATHAFSSAGEFVAYPGGLDGWLDWDETWRTAAGDEVGDFSATALLRATGNYP